MKKLLERDLREPVREYFNAKNYSVFDEARLFARGIDIVAKRRSKIVAVELKVEKWRQIIN